MIGILPYQGKNGVVSNTDDAIELAKLLRVDGSLPAQLAVKTDDILVRQSQIAFLPDFWLHAQLILADPNVVSILLNITSSYIYDKLKGGSTFKGSTSLNIYVTRPDGETRLITYEGTDEGLKGVAEAIRAAVE
ncbi:hypothetical protein EON64_10270 [archaeon]|nr:MAG: hypothetical protein EON64_10270 [archaeon]